MASLTGQQINNSYQGLLKTEDNAAITGTVNLTDGEGTQTGLRLEPANNKLAFSKGLQTDLAVENTGFVKTNYPMSATAGNYIGLALQGNGGAQTGSIIQDRYGSVYYKNINGNFSESHVFQSQTNTGAYAPGVIRIDTYNSINNSNNWFTGYNQSVTDLQVVGSDLTLTRQGASPLTVTLPGGGGAAGLVAGTGTNSMRNADTLANGSTASGENTIALGNGAQADELNAIAFGQGAYSSGVNSVAIGQGATAEGDVSITIGDGNTNQNGPNMSIGRGNNNYANGSNVFGQNNNMGLGNGGCQLLASNINVPAGQNDFVGIGRINNPSGSVSNSIQIGLVSQVTNSQNSVAIGRSSSVINASNSVAVGRGASATTGQSVAVGYNVTATRSDFVTVNQLELKTVGGGIILPSPDGTLYKITVANGGTLTVSAV